VRIVNYIKPMRSTLGLAATALAVCVSLQAQQPPILGSPATAARGAESFAGDRIFVTTKVHRIHLTVSAAEWAALQTSAQRGGGAVGGSDYRDSSGRLIHAGSGFVGYFPWVRSDVRIEDGAGALSIKDAGLRYKGNLSFARSSAAAPLFANFKLKFDVHGTKGTWDGEKTFNLHAGVVDTSKMRDAVAYAIFRAAGVPAPRTAYAELIFTVPGVYQETSAGMFTLIEDVNNRLLARVLPPGNGLLMKPEGARGGVNLLDSWAQYIQTYRPDRGATAHEQQRVMDFGRLISQTDVALFRSRIGSFLDIDEFLRFIAVNAFIVNTDSYLRGGHNFYLYLDPADDKFRFLPWDQDLAMGRSGAVMVFNGVATAAAPAANSFNSPLDILRPAGTDQPLIYWLLDDPAVYARYKEILRELGTKAFAEPELMRLVDALEAAGAGKAGNSPREFLRARAAYMQQVLSQLK
jgi:spore coat protein H